MTLASTLLASPLAAQQDSVPEKPTLTVRIAPEKAYLQEQIVQAIMLISPYPFEEIVLDLPPVDNAEIITLQQPKNRKFETYGGEGYIYETSRAIFPKASGPLLIPTVRISGRVALSRDESESFAVRSEAMTLDVRPPPAGFSEPWWLVAQDVQIEEAWSKPLDEIRLGDHVTRAIEVTVDGVTAAHLPELEQGRSRGLTVLPGLSERKTEITPSGIIGKISRTFDIRIDTDQPINISPVRLVWWQTDSETERRSAAPSVRIEPLPRDVEQLVSTLMADAAAARTSSRYGLFLLGFAFAAVALAFAFWAFRYLRRVRPEDRTLHRALAEDGSPEATVRALLAWGEATFPERRPMNLAQIAQKLGPEAEVAVTQLQRMVFGPAPIKGNAADLARNMVALAQNNRRRPLAYLLRDGMDAVLGPRRTLAAIDPARRHVGPTGT